MTKAELLERLNRIAERKTKDQVQDHIDADWLLLEFIGDPEVSSAFVNIDKWYE